MVQVEQANEPAQKSQVAEYTVQNATQPVCPLECMPRLLIERSILKSRMNREVHVRFCEEQGVRIPLLTRLAVVLLSRKVSLKQCQGYFKTLQVKNYKLQRKFQTNYSRLLRK